MNELNECVVVEYLCGECNGEFESPLFSALDEIQRTFMQYVFLYIQYKLHVLVHSRAIQCLECRAYVEMHLKHMCTA